MKKILLLLCFGSLSLLAAAQAKENFGAVPPPWRAPQKPMRHFLVGVIAVGPGQGGIWTGGLDFFLSEYPNRQLVSAFVTDSFHVKDVHIIAVTEMSDSNYVRFWGAERRAPNAH